VLFVTERKQIVPRDRVRWVFIEPNPTSAACAFGCEDRLFPNLGFACELSRAMHGCQQDLRTDRKMKEREKKVVNGYAGHAARLRRSELDS
jgi:hypothetical protein